MSGGVKKVTISNCVFDGTDRGIRLKSTCGRGGIVEDIRVSNIVMSNIKKEAIVLNLKHSKMPAEPKSDRTPEFRNISVCLLYTSPYLPGSRWLYQARTHRQGERSGCHHASACRLLCVKERPTDSPVSYTHLDVYKRQLCEWYVQFVQVREHAVCDWTFGQGN